MDISSHSASDPFTCHTPGLAKRLPPRACASSLGHAPWGAGRAPCGDWMCPSPCRSPALPQTRSVLSEANRLVSKLFSGGHAPSCCSLAAWGEGV